MKRGKAPASSPLPQEEWNFSKLSPDDGKPAFVYEYARELCRWDAGFAALSSAQRRRALADAFGLGEDAAPGSGEMHEVARWTLAESFPATPWQKLGGDEKGGVHASVYPFPTTLAGIYGSQLGLLPLRACSPGTIPKMREVLPREFSAVLGGIVSSEPNGIDHGLFAIDWTAPVSQLVPAFERWLRLEGNRRKLAGLPTPPDLTDKGHTETLKSLPGYRVSKNRRWKEDLCKLGALRVQDHYSPRELADYGDSNLKVDAPYSHLPDLSRAAKSARGLLDRLAQAAKTWTNRR